MTPDNVSPVQQVKTEKPMVITTSEENVDASTVPVTIGVSNVNDEILTAMETIEEAEIAGADRETKATNKRKKKTTKTKVPKEPKESKVPKGSKSSKSSSTVSRIPRPRSAWILFLTSVREEKRAEHSGLSFAELCAAMASTWRDMDDEAKRPFQEGHNADVARYQRDLSRLSENDRKQIMKRRKRPRTSHTRPKSALSPYMWFAKEFRPKVVAENPTFSFADIGRELGRRWREMNETDKQPYVKLAEADKARYLTEVSENASDNATPKPTDNATENAESYKKRNVSPRKRQKTNVPVSPVNNDEAAVIAQGSMATVTAVKQAIASLGP